MNRLKNQKGVALILVISAVMIITFIVTDFWSDAQLGHQMALNYKSRVQSYYMAKSALNFSKLLLYYNKKIESELKKKKLSFADIGFQALYKQVPINSEGLRGLISAARTLTDTGGEGEGEVDENLENTKKTLGMLQSAEVESFLDFEGNFDAVISEEQSKYSLNAVSKMTSTSSGYDLHKKILLSVLLRSNFKNFFENQDSDAEELVHAISDFVDSNSSINEFDKVERGSEESNYDNVDYKVKNAPYLTLSEIRLVEGMSDDIYHSLQPLVTVYHTNDKINVCLAEPEIVDALIVHYTKYSECTTPLDPEDKEDIEKLRDTILAQCPDKTAVATTLNQELGIKSTDEEDKPSTADSKKTSSKVTGCKIQFEDLLTENNNIFRITGVGEVRGVKTTITLVMDTSSSKVKNWKVLYYQID